MPVSRSQSIRLFKLVRLLIWLSVYVCCAGNRIINRFISFVNRLGENRAGSFNKESSKFVYPNFVTDQIEIAGLPVIWKSRNAITRLFKVCYCGLPAESHLSAYGCIEE